MRKPLIAGNWKMHKLLNEAVQCAIELKSLTANVTHCEIVIAPVFVHLKTICDRLENSNVRVAAQNCAAAQQQFAARTGEVSAAMIKDVGCSHVIIGHSERRQFEGETDEIVNQKIQAALSNNLTAIVCVGETLAEREGGKTEKTIATQLRVGLRGLTSDDLKSIIIAYEPVWAIGTGQVATPEQAQEIHGFIRRALLAENHSNEVAENTRILYGGSVKPDNIRGLMSQTDIDGVLVGGASLQANSFAEIINYK
jgi:triosephosphate isomerase